MRLEIDPLVAPCDEKLTIVVSQVPPGAKVKLACSLCLPWAKSVGYRSQAWFTADDRGMVDPSVQKPDSGSYDYVDGMGLIASVTRDGSGDVNDIARNIGIDEDMSIDVTAECAGESASVRLRRTFKAPGVKVAELPNGLVGRLFYTEPAASTTVVLLGGSGGELGPLLPWAALLASHGFTVVALAYFKEPGLPKSLSRIPLEYFDRAFAWLADDPVTAGSRTALMAMSKGAELALLLAARHPVVTRVAAFAPHAWCFQGLDFRNRSSWTVGGVDLPYIRLRNRTVFASMLRAIVRNEPFGFAETYTKELGRAQNKEAARIKLENSQADLIMFAGKRDQMWNSYDGCVQIMADHKARGSQARYELITYEDAGHPFYPPYVIPPGEATAKMAPRLRFTSGGTLRGNAFAQADSWEKAIAFLGEDTPARPRRLDAGVVQPSSA